MTRLTEYFQKGKPNNTVSHSRYPKDPQMKASDAKRYWHDGGSNQNGTNSAVVEGRTIFGLS